jgi:hypothetical protein
MFVRLGVSIEYTSFSFILIKILCGLYLAPDTTSDTSIGPCLPILWFVFPTGLTRSMTVRYLKCLIYFRSINSRIRIRNVGDMDTHIFTLAVIQFVRTDIEFSWDFKIFYDALNVKQVSFTDIHLKINWKSMGINYISYGKLHSFDF